MKFRFCGDGDCPDWVLAEIHSTLSVLTAIKLKLLTQLVIKSILGDEIPEDKLQEMFAKTDKSEIKSGIACIRYLIINAARYHTDEATFSAELQQLGLPKEHSVALCRVYFASNVAKYLQDNNFTVNELESISYDIPEDTVDCVRLSFDIRNEIVDGIPTKTSHKINIHKDNVKILLKEMKTVRDLHDATFNKTS